jgi:putative transposase
MPRRKLIFEQNQSYHVYNRGINREPIFFEAGNYPFFLRRLKEHLADSDIRIIAYCLMPNHYHLLVRPSQESLTRAMQSLSVSYAKAVNRRYNRTGVLFQGRFQAIHVDCEEYLVHLTRYIHLSPLKAKLVEQPEQWEYSSYPEYLAIRGGKLPRPDGVLSYFSSRLAYQSFVEAGAGLHRDDPTISHLMLD